MTAETSLADLLKADHFHLPSSARAAGDGSSQWWRTAGSVGGVAFLLIVSFMQTPQGLTIEGQRAVAIFGFALAWWIFEPVPTHVTSMLTMTLLVFLRATAPASVLAVFGLDVVWLNILAFILSGMLIKTKLARRWALMLIGRFGGRAATALGAFVVLQLLLAPLIPATAARTAITLPLMMAMAAIYGSSARHPTNFGRNLFLLNLTAISVLSSAVMTGSAANIMAVGFIQSLGGHKVYYSEWLIASAPVALLTVAGAWWLGPRAIFPLAPVDRVPRLEGGLAEVERERKSLGPLSPIQWRAIAIFLLVIFLWATDRFQKAWFGVEIGPSIAAMVGATLALMPKIGVIEWDDTDIPWHLIIFSAGAYAAGLTLESTGAAKWAVDHLFGALRLDGIAFGWVYAAVVAVMIYSHLLSTSKTVRTVIMLPAIILLARALGWPPASLALPAAFTIDWVIGLPISGKPNVILFGTRQYSAADNLRYGLIVCTIGYALLLIAGATWFHWLDLTPAFTARN